MNLLVFSAIGMLIAIIGIVTIIFLTARTFKNTAWIARQTGQGTNDVMWFHDKFRVVNREGAWVIEFKKIKEKTKSIDGKYWTKFLLPKSVPKLLKYTKETWDTMNMRSHLARGLFLYETTEGEFYPMTIERKEGAVLFSVLDQDNRQFLITGIQEVNDLTRNHKQEVALLWGVIIGIAVLALVFFIGMWWQGHEHDKNLAASAAVCQAYAYQVVNITSSHPNTFLNDLTGMVGGPAPPPGG